MTTYLALLRGINVGGYRKVAMADLRAVLTRLGFHDARSVIQSGNLIFRGPARSTALLEHQLQAEVAKRLGLQTEFFVRTAEEWDGIVAGNPFPDAARRDPARLVVMLLRAAPARKALAALRAAITGPEVVQTKDRQAYIVYAQGIGTSRLTSGLIEQVLGNRGTVRNWSTVFRLAALIGA